MMAGIAPLTTDWFDAYALGAALAAILAVAVLAWLASLWLRQVSFVDSLWSIFFVIAAVTFATAADAVTARGTLVLVLLVAWAIRLSVYITLRNRGAGEDRRYQAIRRNNEPGFAYKSLYIVFGLQGALAWFIAWPLLPAIGGASELAWLDGVALALFAVGMVFEAGADWQLARFQSRPDTDSAVLDSGLWRYTRHPNYFGEFCIWWAFYLFAVAAGGAMTILSPLLLSFLLLRVSGVSLLEKDIGERRPAYREYAKVTNAFFPGPRSGIGNR